ncbi:MAG: hypothetical protein VX777_03415 [Chlamydiota bacterium]|nr:hypothetical protein [Chlamydiota bacterium]
MLPITNMTQHLNRLNAAVNERQPSQEEVIFMRAQKEWEETGDDSANFEKYVYSRKNITPDCKVIKVTIALPIFNSNSKQSYIDFSVRCEEDCKELMRVGKEVLLSQNDARDTSFIDLENEPNTVRYSNAEGGGHMTMKILRSLEEFDPHLEEVRLLVDGVPAQINRNP